MMGLTTWIKRGLGGPIMPPVEEFRREFPAGDVFGVSNQILHILEKIMSALTDLQAAVAAATGVDGNAVATINALNAQVADLTKQLAAAQAASGTPDAALQPLTDALNAANASVAAVAPAAPAA